MTLAAVARLLGAVDGRPVTVIDAGPGWTNIPKSTGPAIWGRAPAPSGTPLALALKNAAQRERALRRVRGVKTRWNPPDLGGLAAKNALRNALLAGAIVEVDRPQRRVIDAMAEEAGGRVESFRPASGGTVLARLTGKQVLLRAGGEGNEAEALETLDHPLVPRLLGRGEGWTAESLLPGNRPARITPEVWRACAELCASLPRSAAPKAPRADLATIPNLDEKPSEALNALDRLPGIARHGDLWRPNLLTQRGTLTGVVDWDAWHPAAAPGTDLLNLYATEHHGPGIGRAWRAKPWRSEGFASATAGYWSALGVRPAPEQLDAIAVAWWAGQVSASLRRLPHLREDAAWLEENVYSVVRSL